MSPHLPLPKYHQIYLVLREQLEEGRYADGVPGEHRLTKQFGVARVTVRKALERLQAEGMIERSPGRGTVALRPTADRCDPPRASARLTGLLENIVSMGLATSVRVIDCEELAAPEPVARELRIAPGAPVQKAVRVRSTREGPLSHITTYVPAVLARGFGRRELAKKPILILLEESGVRIGRATQSISARLADSVVAARLGVEVGSPLLAVSRLIFDEQERPVQWLQGLYRPDRYHYEMELSRVGGIDAKVWVSRELTAQFH
ncbi:MAG: GntR family transcriptional regulator [Burkholderiales bacterium]|nr:MAG: GntR family transcriptional regulator [Burkholderiales bacterium]